MTDNDTRCPICGSSGATINTDGYGDAILHITCPSCGYFSIYNGLITSLDSDKEQKRLLAGYLYETKKERKSIVDIGNKLTVIDSNELDKILSSPLIPKTPIEHFEKLIVNIYKNGANINKIPREFPASGYATNKFELTLMFKNLSDEGYLCQESGLMLTLKGMKYAESIINRHSLSKRAFIAMKFDDDELKKIKTDAIKPAAKECHFEAITVDDDNYIGGIPDRIKAEIKRSRFMIADYTYNNLGVYYESGYAMGLGIPVIKTCNTEYFHKDGVHFDVKQDNFILWNGVDDLKQKLIDRINAII